MKWSCRHAFTLIEMLVVISIIAVIAGIIFPVLFWAREKAQQTVCASNLRQLGMATMMYAQDNDEYVPPFLNFSPSVCLPGGPEGLQPGCAPDLLYISLSPYIRDSRVWFCPSDPVAGQDTNVRLNGGVFINHRFSSYYFYFRLDQFMRNIDGYWIPPSGWHPPGPGPPSIYLPREDPPSKAQMIFDCSALHFGGVNYLYFDGYLKWEK